MDFEDTPEEAEQVRALRRCEMIGVIRREGEHSGEAPFSEAPIGTLTFTRLDAPPVYDAYLPLTLSTSP